MSFLTKLFSPKSALNSYKSELTETNSYTEEIAGLSEEQIQKEINNFKQEVSKIEKFEDIYKKLLEIRPRVFALVREATKRMLNQPHYDVQIIGGFVLSEGKIAEM